MSSKTGPPSLFSKASYRKIQDDLTRRCIEKDHYIHKLEDILREHGIELPASQMVINPALYDLADNMMKHGSIEELETLMEKNKSLIRNLDVSIEFHNLCYSTEVPKNKVLPTVGSTLLSLFTFWLPQPKVKVDILADATGRIQPRKMTLLLGPPGSGKSGMLQ